MFRAHVLIIRRSKLHYTAYGIITPIGGRLVHITRGCVMQFWPPDDEHMCSKYAEAWNKLIVKQKFCASSWLITEINILRCTVSKTSKLTVIVNWWLEETKTEKKDKWEIRIYITHLQHGAQAGNFFLWVDISKGERMKIFYKQVRYRK